MSALRQSPSVEIKGVTIKTVTACALAIFLAACGGGGGGGSSAPAPLNSGGGGSNNTTPGFANGTFAASTEFRDMCANPRVGNFPDVAGTTEDENNWLRSWSNELYLWYDEINDQDPSAFTTPDYFDLMKTEAITASGAPKDKFHFTIPTDEWIARSQSGISAGYGAQVVVLAGTPPREVVVAFSSPGTPAGDAGLTRGARFIEVDGADVVNGNTQADVDALNAGLFPGGAGESHTFVVQDLGSTSTRTITMISAETAEDPVQFEQVIDTGTDQVGYLFFSDHNVVSESQLIDAMANFSAANITELILDLRYNQGGFLDIANELAYMVVGSSANGRVFDTLEFNDKNPDTNPVTGEPLTPTLFHQTSQIDDAIRGTALPTVNGLSRVFVLSGPDTCSASEAIINGLRGVGFEVILIGDTTCGKPYGFYAFDNCGTTYFSVQFRGVNAQGFGDYTDGFSPETGAQTQGTTIPGCFVADDFGSALGDLGEGRLAAALDYINTGSCPAATTSGAPGRLAVEWPNSGPELTAPWKPGSVLLR